MEKVYLCIIEDCVDFDTQKEIKVFKTLEKAQKYAKEEIEKVNEEYFDGGVIEIEKYYCSVYLDGRYAQDHIDIYIEEKKVF